MVHYDRYQQESIAIPINNKNYLAIENAVTPVLV